MEDERAVYRKWVREVSGGKLAVYYPGLVQRVGGVKAGLLLSQLLYWNGTQVGDTGAEKRGGWFYKSVEELQRETGLTKCEQQTARRALIALGVIEARLRGIPRVWYYRVNLPRLVELMEAEDLPEAGAHPVEAPLDGNTGQQKGQTHPTSGRNPAQFNNESKNTTENTNKLARDARLGHPAVVLLKTVTGMSPPKAVLDRVIHALGDAPEAERFAEIHETWCTRGYRPTNLEGQLDWYRKGIPPAIPPGRAGRLGTQAPPVKRLADGPPGDAELDDLREKLRAVRKRRD